MPTGCVGQVKIVKNIKIIKLLNYHFYIFEVKKSYIKMKILTCHCPKISFYPLQIIIPYVILHAVIAGKPDV